MEKIKELRIKYSLSQAQIAQKIGVSIRTVGAWEREENSPREKEKIELKRLFNELEREQQLSVYSS